MSQVNAVYKLHKILRDKVLEMLKNPSISQSSIVDTINTEAGKQVISKSSLCRFVKDREKYSGTKRGMDRPSTEESLSRTAAALERIADSMEKVYKKPN
jgi:hypothetical protein